MDANVPMTVICSKASEDIRTLLEGIMKEHLSGSYVHDHKGRSITL